jgi:hypothetical protein
MKKPSSGRKEEKFKRRESGIWIENGKILSVEMVS